MNVLQDFLNQINCFCQYCDFYVKIFICLFISSYFRVYLYFRVFLESFYISVIVFSDVFFNCIWNPTYTRFHISYWITILCVHLFPLMIVFDFVLLIWQCFYVHNIFSVCSSVYTLFFFRVSNCYVDISCSCTLSSSFVLSNCWP